MQPKRGVLLTILAVLFALGGIQDALKPFHLVRSATSICVCFSTVGGSTTALVFLGTRLSGIANLVMSIVLAIFLISYAVGVWRMRKYALTLSLFYGVYVIINIVVFSFKYAGQDNGPVLFLIIFTVLAIAIPWTSAIILWRRRAELT
ncbi:MAG: hypothetical protein ACLQAT_08275 [Candidatus Binataceae bacterium]